MKPYNIRIEYGKTKPSQLCILESAAPLFSWACAAGDGETQAAFSLRVLHDGEAVWHADMTYKPVPPKAALLLAREVPPSGGDTWFANLYEAYETLPAALRERIEHLQCVHDASRNSAGELRLGFVDNTDSRQTVGAVHPLVRLNPATGRHSRAV